MAAINFPNSPNAGDTHTVGNRVWYYDGASWLLANTTIAMSAAYDKANAANQLANGAFLQANVANTLTVGNTLSNGFFIVRSSQRSRLNFVPASSNLRIEITDDSAGDRINVNIETFGGGGGGGITEIVQDTSPELGGDLDLNTFDILDPDHSANITANVINADFALIVQRINVMPALIAASAQSNIAMLTVSSAYDRVNVVSGVANVANDRANLAQMASNGAYDKANAANILANQVSAVAQTYSNGYVIQMSTRGTLNFMADTTDIKIQVQDNATHGLVNVRFDAPGIGASYTQANAAKTEADAVFGVANVHNGAILAANTIAIAAFGVANVHNGAMAQMNTAIFGAANIANTYTVGNTKPDGSYTIRTSTRTKLNFINTGATLVEVYDDSTNDRANVVFHANVYLDGAPKLRGNLENPSAFRYELLDGSWYIQQGATYNFTGDDHGVRFTGSGTGATRTWTFYDVSGSAPRYAINIADGRVTAINTISINVGNTHFHNNNPALSVWELWSNSAHQHNTAVINVKTAVDGGSFLRVLDDGLTVFRVMQETGGRYQLEVSGNVNANIVNADWGLIIGRQNVMPIITASYGVANTANDRANLAQMASNAAFAVANGALQTTGGTMTGNINFGTARGLTWTTPGIEIIGETGGNIQFLGANIFMSTIGSTSTAPRTFGMNDFASGRAARWQFGDSFTAIQNGWGSKMGIYAYHGIKLAGGQAGTPLTFETGAAGADYSLDVLGDVIITTGNLSFRTDNSEDIGSAAALRPRDVHVGRNVHTQDIVVTRSAIVSDLNIKPAIVAAYTHANAAMVQANTSNLMAVGNTIAGNSYFTVRGNRTRLNFLEGSGVTINVDDDSAGDRINVTIAKAAGDGMTQLSDDTDPELGGDLDLNGHDIVGTGNVSITGNIILNQPRAFWNANIAFDMTADWANTAQTFTLIRANVANIANAGSLSKFIDLQANGVTKFAVTSNGIAQANLVQIFADGSSVSVLRSGGALLGELQFQDSAGSVRARLNMTAGQFQSVTGFAIDGESTSFTGSGLDLTTTDTISWRDGNFGTQDIYISRANAGNLIVTHNGTGRANIHASNIYASNSVVGIDLRATNNVHSQDIVVTRSAIVSDLNLVPAIVGAFTQANTSNLMAVGNTISGNSYFTVRGNRTRLNFIPGTNITINVDDDAAGDRVNVTLAASGTGITEVNDDSDPELGGTLDLSTFGINGTGWVDITGEANVTGNVSVSGNLYTNVAQTNHIWVANNIAFRLGGGIQSWGNDLIIGRDTGIGLRIGTSRVSIVTELGIGTSGSTPDVFLVRENAGNVRVGGGTSSVQGNLLASNITAGNTVSAIDVRATNNVRTQDIIVTRSAIVSDLNLVPAIVGAFTQANTSNLMAVGNTIASNAYFTVRGNRSRINFIPGANVTINVADDAAGDRVNVTIESYYVAGDPGGPGGGMNLTAGNTLSNTYYTTRSSAFANINFMNDAQDYIRWQINDDGTNFRINVQPVIAPVFVSDSPPATPRQNTLWFEANTGSMFMYFADSNSSQWIEIGGFGPGVDPEDVLTLDIGDETTTLTTGTAKKTYNMLKTFNVLEVMAGLSANGTSNTYVDVNKNGTTIFSTNLNLYGANSHTLNYGSSVLSTNPTQFARGDRITVDIDAAGTSAAGLKVHFRGYWV